ncbi:hypothetical protein [Sabulibacter ruber]|uniref:hypothetical protein n=1 Tax=Sabulibacter ruber TaxID=2811901 RepID=UPI001A973735|nr:hypothetical protein [Sabulibacter ruber]
MEQNQKTKALTDLIENPKEIAAIVADPADGGMRFYKALRDRDKQFVAFAAGLGLIAYGFYLRSSSHKTHHGHGASGHLGAGQTGSATGGSATGAAHGTADHMTTDAITGTPTGTTPDMTGASGDYSTGDYQGGGDYNQHNG